MNDTRVMPVRTMQDNGLEVDDAEQWSVVTAA